MSAADGLRSAPLSLPQHRFPIDEWRLVELEPSTADLGVTETLFAVGNGYLGMRANPEEGRNAVELVNAITLSSLRRRSVRLPLERDEVAAMLAELRALLDA